MNKFLKMYRESEDIAKFFFWLSVFFSTMSLALAASYYFQINLPLPVSGLATTNGVVEEARVRYQELSLFSKSKKAESVEIGSDKAVTSGLAGYFIPNTSLDKITAKDVYKWGKYCGAYYGQKLQVIDGYLVIRVYTSNNLEEEVDLCSEDLPSEVKLYKVMITRLPDDNFYYYFNRVTLPVRYTLDTE